MIENTDSRAFRILFLIFSGFRCTMVRASARLFFRKGIRCAVSGADLSRSFALYRRRHAAGAATGFPFAISPRETQAQGRGTVVDFPRLFERAGSDFENRQKLREKMEVMLQNPDLVGKIGCFEGAGYASQRIYRPALNCRMFSKSLVNFCPVCEQAVIRMIDFTIGKPSLGE
jgi:hypothetical protein